ncbi:PREDICTED: uncharacterized protein LOC109381362 [Hipposideros armiger]|uniref:Uncharacterized protein LOC109381362 n=1 Tax=Hipposideros armiger TaxID=186990 RepID=A0A8B7R6Z8_HIPAR|nr:PREDICTED: uncharacterized protein LOC109381362 [Hipposideros armiger]
MSASRPGEGSGRSAPCTNAPGLTPPPGAHWPAPRPPACEVQGVGGWRWWSVASLQRQAWLLCRDGASPAGQTPGRWGGPGRGEGEGRRGQPRSAPGVTDSGGSRRADPACAHSHGALTRRGAGTHGHRLPADKRTQRPGLGACSWAHALLICGRRGAQARHYAPSPRSLLPPTCGPKPRREQPLDTVGLTSGGSEWEASGAGLSLLPG